VNVEQASKHATQEPPKHFSRHISSVPLQESAQETAGLKSCALRLVVRGVPAAVGPASRCSSTYSTTAGASPAAPSRTGFSRWRAGPFIRWHVTPTTVHYGRQQLNQSRPAKAVPTCARPERQRGPLNPSGRQRTGQQTKDERICPSEYHPPAVGGTRSRAAVGRRQIDRQSVDADAVTLCEAKREAPFARQQHLIVLVMALQWGPKN
jgi:hypothetical protein